MLYLTNALPGTIMLEGGCIVLKELTAKEATDKLGDAPAWKSAVGHLDTASLFANLLGKCIAMNRVSLPDDLLVQGDEMLAGLYSGPRLPEGTQTLPEGAKVRWALVSKIHVAPDVLRRQAARQAGEDEEAMGGDYDTAYMQWLDRHPVK